MSTTTYLSELQGVDLNSCTVKFLKEVCRINNLKGYSKMKKQELVDFLLFEIEQDEIFTAHVEKIEQETGVKDPSITHFHIEGFTHTYEGFTWGNTWNGWERPYFTIDVAHHLIDAMLRDCDVSYYDAEKDMFVVKFDEEDCGEEFYGSDIVYQGKTYHVYDIGNGSWCWDEVILGDENEMNWLQCEGIEVLDMECF